MRTQLLKLFQPFIGQNVVNSRNASTTYRSSISLKSLYPESSLNIATPVKPPQNESGKFCGYIPIDKLDISYCRSPGPGGQHVNKVNTKVDIRFHLSSAEWLDDATKKLLAEKHDSRLNREGYFIVRSDKTRSQVYNQADAITTLREIIFRVIKASEVVKPSEETLHMLRKRKERANMERLAKKRVHSQKKSERRALEI